MLIILIFIKIKKGDLNEKAVFDRDFFSPYIFC